jgi:alkylhydroperoxidase family enzyme
VAALREDYTNAPISHQDRVMLDYVVKLTKDATRCSPEDHDKLREAGFDDRGILQITLIASWFNYINRVADALGVGRDGGGGLLRPSGKLQTAEAEPQSR